MVAKIFKKIIQKRYPIYLAAICIVAFVLYFPSLFTFYTNDDFFHLKIANVNTLNGFLNFFNLIKAPEGWSLYRPLTTQVFYLISIKFFNLNPLPLHIISFLFLFLNIFLVFALTRILIKNNGGAILAAFFYATSATHFGHLYFLGAFQELGMTTFFLVSILLFIKFVLQKKYAFYLVSLLTFVFALLSKETAVVLPFVLVLVGIFRLIIKEEAVSLKKLFAYLIPYFILLAVYFFLRLKYYGFATGESYIWDFSIKRVVNTLGWYGFWSFNLPEMLVDFVGPGLHFNLNLFKYWPSQIIPILLLFVVEIVSIFYLILKSKFLNYKQSLALRTKSSILILFCIAWFVMTLIPVLFLPLHKFTFYLTLPLVGIVILLGYLIMNLKSRIINLFLMTTWLVLSVLTLNLTRQTNWITQGGATAKRVYDYFQLNRNSLVGKTIVFYDTKDDESLPFSPTATLKNVLSDNNFFEVFYYGKMKVVYGGAPNKRNEVMIKSRMFLGY